MTGIMAAEPLAARDETLKRQKNRETKFQCTTHLYILILYQYFQYLISIVDTIVRFSKLDETELNGLTAAKAKATLSSVSR